MQKSNTITKTESESGKPSSLAALRADAGMTQVELAAAVGVGQGRISEWERGAHVPSAKSCMRLASALRIDPGVVVASAMQSSR